MKRRGHLFGIPVRILHREPVELEGKICRPAPVVRQAHHEGDLMRAGKIMAEKV